MDLGRISQSLQKTLFGVGGTSGETAKMSLIVGLGNPGGQYHATRHNIGFMCVDAWADAQGFAFAHEAKHKALLAKGRFNNQSVMLAKPQTYMNLSGTAVSSLIQYYKLDLDQVLLVFDDVALPFGRIRFRKQGSAGTHNGMKSILKALGTQAIPRLRIGVSEPPPQWDLADYVLARFTEAEQAQLPQIIATCTQALTCWLAEGTEQAMNRYNSLEILPVSTNEGLSEPDAV